ncbi:MAG: lipoprotein [Gammaproteobacteria bacterium]
MRWTTICLLAALVASCGQKGPLTLPEDTLAALSNPAWTHFAPAP